MVVTDVFRLVQLERRGRRSADGPLDRVVPEGQHRAVGVVGQRGNPGGVHEEQEGGALRPVLGFLWPRDDV